MDTVETACTSAVAISASFLTEIWIARPDYYLFSLCQKYILWIKVSHKRRKKVGLVAIVSYQTDRLLNFFHVTVLFWECWWQYACPECSNVFSLMTNTDDSNRCTMAKGFEKIAVWHEHIIWNITSSLHQFRPLHWHCARDITDVSPTSNSPLLRPSDTLLLLNADTLNVVVLVSANVPALQSVLLTRDNDLCMSRIFWKCNTAQ